MENGEWGNKDPLHYSTFMFLKLFTLKNEEVKPTSLNYAKLC